MMGGMNAIMNVSALQTIEQVETFLTAAATVEFRFEDTPAGYAWIQATLARFGYATLPRPHKGVLRRYLRAVTGYSRAQVARLIRGFQKTGQVRRQAGSRHRFAMRYTAADIRLLAKTDELHATLSGPATKKICERAFHVFGNAAFERLACSKSAISTTCVRRPVIRAGATTSLKRSHANFPLALGANPPRKASPAICARWP